MNKEEITTEDLSRGDDKFVPDSNRQETKSLDISDIKTFLRKTGKSISEYSSTEEVLTEFLEYINSRL